jgi:hypothetical protein
VKLSTVGVCAASKRNVGDRRRLNAAIVCYIIARLGVADLYFRLFNIYIILLSPMWNQIRSGTRDMSERILPLLTRL